MTEKLLNTKALTFGEFLSYSECALIQIFISMCNFYENYAILLF